MSVRLFSASMRGIDASLIEVEVDSTPGLHSFNIVGLPDKAVEESKDRIASAIRNTGLVSPAAKNRKIIINLAPADVRKEGPIYDLPIAVGYLFETGQIKFDPSRKIFAGELSLDGSLKHINGILAIAIMAKNLGFDEMIVPIDNTKEAAVVEGINIIGAKTIKDVVDHLMGSFPISPTSFRAVDDKKTDDNDDGSFIAIKGQESAKRALSVAAAGGHNMLMFGPPGSGKTLLAKALAGLLPKMQFEEAIEVAKIYSSVGLLGGSPLSFTRPFRSPHHTTSSVAVIGGGTNPRPGEISLAHRGVLFLDEFPEFPRNILESLRQPMEDGSVSVSRAAGSVVLPSKFMLIAAMNPCPCGNYGDERLSCQCSPFNVVRYRKKVSGPLLDRIDVQIIVPRETYKPTAHTEQVKTNIKDLKAKIISARKRQLARYEKMGIFTNSELDYKNIDRFCPLSPDAEKLLELAVNMKGLSLRACHKIKKLARTIADLESSENIAQEHVAEALALKVNEKIGEFL